ncbi:WAS/WASL-interacting protein family member 3-like [Anoplopoma fimbria]|uniref:WAS/WASL-interacting protein family member 3-like n=1 Tax=Anoplopoma fimbria TaxID=229290 RepID=UPI0023EDB428|nr:WAS/WASL-interacting protein family member 3-like [Anoplopoma fimbria]
MSLHELVRLAAERQGDSAPLSPVQSQVTVGQTFGFDDQQTSERTSTSSGAPAEKEEEEQTALAPPKPPMPLTEHLPQVSLPQVSLPQVSPQGVSPPALPPKRRSSSGPALSAGLP